ASCGVLLAVIGKNWLSVVDKEGKRRLDDPYDFVRLETASALKRDIPVIPVLVHDAGMPRAEQLPDDLKELAFRNSVELTHARWSSDVQLLIKALLPYVDTSALTPPAVPGPPPAPVSATTDRRARWALVPLTALVLGGGGYIAWNRFKPAPVVDKQAAVASAPVAVVVPTAAPASAPAPEAPATSSPAKTQPLDKPATVAARAPAVARTPPASVSTPAPKPAPVLAAAPAATPAPAPAPATVSAPAPSPSPLPEVVAGRSDPSLELLGSPGAVSMVTRSIAIKPDTNFVNVTGGEVIRFDVGSKSFV
ncbi:MAG: CzcE family metal-binding protein, partial [Rhizobacter sp.]